MADRTRLPRAELIALAKDIDLWETVAFQVSANATEDEVRACKNAQREYERNFGALRDYARFLPLKEIARNWGLRPSRVTELWRRAVTPDANGVQPLAMACVPKFRRAFKRKVPPHGGRLPGTSARAGLSGQFSALLNEYPAIRECLERLVRKGILRDSVNDKRKEVTLAVVSVSLIHEQLLKWAQESGIGATEYPFCTTHKGLASLRTWVKREQLKHPLDAVNVGAGPSAAKAAAHHHVTTQTMTASPRYVANQRVEVDGSPSDQAYGIWALVDSEKVQLAQGLRPTTLLAKDVGSGATLEHHEVFINRGYNERAVLALVRKMLLPRQRLALPEDSPYQYPAGPVWPRELPGWSQLAPGVIAWDSQSSQQKLLLAQQLHWAVGIQVANEGTASAPKRREVETAFAHEARAQQAAPSATGNRPDSVARERASEVEDFRDASLFVEARQARENYERARGKPISPIEEYARQLRSGEAYMRPLTPHQQNNLAWALSPSFPCTLVLDHHGKPYVQAQYGRYTGPELAAWPDLGRFLNKQFALRAFVLPDASKAVIAAPLDPNDATLGFIPVAKVRIHTGYWSVPHVLEEREYVYRMATHEGNRITKSGALVTVELALSLKGLRQSRGEKMSLAYSLASIQMLRDAAGIASPEASFAYDPDDGVDEYFDVEESPTTAPEVGDSEMPLVVAPTSPERRELKGFASR